MIARRILPLLLPLSIEPCLNEDQVSVSNSLIVILFDLTVQFKMFMRVINQLVSQMESERLLQIQGSDTYKAHSAGDQSVFLILLVLGILFY